MDNVLVLPTYPYQCPVCWQNFVNSSRLPDGSFDEDELAKYNAAYVYDPDDPEYGHVKFASPADLTLFVLRWS
jgi:hypothetical protein